MGGTIVIGSQLPQGKTPDKTPPVQYRSEIFQDSGEFGKFMLYWTLDTAADKPTGRLQLHEIHAACRVSTPLTGEIDIRAALLQIAAKEAEAAEKLKIPDMAKYDNFMNAGHDFHRADSYRQHPVYLADQRVEALKQKAGNGRFKLKPGL